MLTKPSDPTTMIGALKNIHFSAEPSVTHAWCRRFATVLGADNDLIGDIVNLTDRLADGRRQRQAYRRPVQKQFLLVTPVGDVLLSKDDPLSQQFFSVLMPDGRLHEPGLVAFLCRILNKSSVFIDIGAHSGYFACIAGVAGASVVTMEFQQPLNRVIERNLALNGITRARVLDIAASDRDGVTVVPSYNVRFGAKLYTEQVGFKPHLVPAYGPNSQIVPTMRLDTLFADLDAPPTCIKIDAEGFELRILRGAERLIAACRTTFIVEFHAAHVSQFGNDVSELDTIFPETAWRVIHLQDRGMTELDRDDLRRLIASQDGTENPHLIFRPR
ncbi:MAG: FkbM family methyltransferase [Thalassobaculaceae bacterium]